MNFDPLPEPSPARPSSPPGGPDIPAETEAEFLLRVEALPPLFGGYRWVPELAPNGTFWPGRYEQREGYFCVAAVACFTFFGDGRVAGLTDSNRAGKNFRRNVLTDKSKFTIRINPDFNIYEGTIETFHINEGNIEVHNEYSWIMKNWNELEWVFKRGSYRPLVSHGTFERVLYSPLPPPEPTVGVQPVGGGGVQPG
jgi:hypothetical protein